MKRKALFCAFCSAATVGTLMGFRLYSGFRTLDETVGFQFHSCLVGLVMGMIFPLIAIVPITFTTTLWLKRNMRHTCVFLLVFTLAQLGGCGLGEALLLHDESVFAKEIPSASKIYSRDRTWPSQNASLIFLPDPGIHATD